MKIICLIAALIIFSNCFSQCKCKKKPGYTDIPDMSSSSNIIIGGCYPDSIAKKIMNIFWKGVCLDTGLFMMDKNTSYGNNHSWDDSLGCISKETWKAHIDNKWVEITKKQYDSIRAIKQ